MCYKCASMPALYHPDTGLLHCCGLDCYEVLCNRAFLADYASVTAFLVVSRPITVGYEGFVADDNHSVGTSFEVERAAYAEHADLSHAAFDTGGGVTDASDFLPSLGSDPSSPAVLARQAIRDVAMVTAIDAQTLIADAAGLNVGVPALEQVAAAAAEAAGGAPNTILVSVDGLNVDVVVDLGASAGAGVDVPAVNAAIQAAANAALGPHQAANGSAAAAVAAVAAHIAVSAAASNGSGQFAAAAAASVAASAAAVNGIPGVMIPGGGLHGMSGGAWNAAVNAASAERVRPGWRRGPTPMDFDVGPDGRCEYCVMTGSPCGPDCPLYGHAPDE